MSQILAILPVQELSIKQLQRIEQIRNESYIKEVDYGFCSDGSCHLRIIDYKDKYYSTEIDKDGNYVPHLNG